MAPKTIYRVDYRELIKRLRDRREELGLSQSEIARALGWPQQRLSAVEAGARRLDIIEFFQLTSALGLTAQRAVRLVLHAPKSK
ncbi:helix-turn-helix domain-containing protein [Lysobacter sp. GCM10012299]|uniref:helix-turn-helix domain-containing protein n=1 Tax=Lysobacter sp. GCM10012299 TaxID=3317333 RepID=UPI00362181B6